VFTLLCALGLSTQAAAQDPAGTKAAHRAAENLPKPVMTKEPPPAVDPATLAVGEWVATLSPFGCSPEVAVSDGWLSTILVPTGGHSDCTQTLNPEGKVRTMHGYPAEIVGQRMMFRADSIVYNTDTEDLHAEGHVFYYNFARNEKIWCNRLEYHTEKGNEHGKFYSVVGETMPKIVTRPKQGVLYAPAAPFHFEGAWAERDESRYILHDGWITNCKVPKPWWRLAGPKFDIIPRERAKAYDGVFYIAGVPVFFLPWFYHPLNREPGKSGFLLPVPGNNSLRGLYVGAGYYWHINRSYDLTYEAQIFDSGIITHHAEIRGKPAEGTMFDVVLFGSANDRLASYSPKGLTAFAVARSNLGAGWTAVGSVNYTTTLLFRQDWSQSYNETVGSELDSSGFIDKSWSTYTFDAVMSRKQVFSNVEQEITDPNTGKVSLGPADALTIHKLPELNLTSRDHSIFANLPIWYSFDASAGLMSRNEPIFNSSGTTVVDTFHTNFFTGRAHFAPHLTTAFSLGPIHFVPSIGIDETLYSESQTPYQTYFHVVGADLLRSARDFSIAMILPSLERVYDKKSFLGDKLKHVIEPRMVYDYVSGIGTDFDRFIRFDDTDILSNTSDLDISLANRILAKRGDNVSEIFSWTLEQKRFFDPTFGGALVPGQANVFAATADLNGYSYLVSARSTSPVVSTVRATPLLGLSVQWQTDYDHREHRIVNSAISVDYTWRRYFHVSAGSIQVSNNPLYNTSTNTFAPILPILTPDANQLRGRVWMGDTNRRGWNAGFDSIYDYRQGRMLWATAQVTYNTDCCGLSFQVRRFYRPGATPTQYTYDNTYSVSFSVANIGQFGTLRKQDRLF
jgi:LPS-assembly protein